ncbi:MAG: Gfo/Idh/MocA family oxidoreductase [Gemmatimonadota bacterium]|nr:MAG: Gfo/Idh/MocA family oxidoreductase [Gemmatimonadota bacterium]
MRADGHSVSRRDFIKTSGGVVAASMLAQPSTVAQSLSSQPRSSAKMRYAVVGTGIRGITMWGRSVAREYADYVDIVGLCDINPGRLEFAKDYIGVDCPTFTEFTEMMSQTRPDTLCVTTMDSTHDEFIVKGMEMGCDIVTEKPMTTDEDKCQTILDAQARTRKNVAVTFNYRYSPHRVRMKELLMEGRIGRLTSVDFHWYLDIYHGADYFRRWHGKERYGGTLFVHKSTHHFDLLNWWIESEPEEVFAHGALEYYGHNHPFRHTNCRGCPHSSQCQHYWDITQDRFLTNLYVDQEQHDGYLRDGCVWSTDIDIFDKMAAQIRYANGVQVSYSCTTYSPYEGYRIAFNGTKGRMEAWIKERQPWQAENHDEIRVTDNFGETELIQISHATGGHGGGDTRLLDRIFKDPTAPDPNRLAAGARDGAMSILIGVAARTSVKTGEPVKIASLTTLKPRLDRP